MTCAKVNNSYFRTLIPAHLCRLKTWSKIMKFLLYSRKAGSLSQVWWIKSTWLLKLFVYIRSIFNISVRIAQKITRCKWRNSCTVVLNADELFFTNMIYANSRKCIICAWHTLCLFWICSRYKCPALWRNKCIGSRKLYSI
jgi:hypothetical protein